jgi:hypothetical protein
MNTTNSRWIPLQSGQALALDRHRSAKVFLAEGEVLLQAPAQWLGGTLVLAPPRRLAAPAAWTGAGIDSIRALGSAKVLIEEAASPLALLKAAWDAFRLGWLRLPRPSRK